MPVFKSCILMLWDISQLTASLNGYTFVGGKKEREGGRKKMRYNSSLNNDSSSCGFTNNYATIFDP